MKKSELLVDCIWPCPDVQADSEVSLWLRFNDHVRAELVNTSDHAVWVDKLLEGKHDTDYAFKLLSMNPSLMDIPTNGRKRTSEAFGV